jgi:hypothetical protein
VDGCLMVLCPPEATCELPGLFALAGNGGLDYGLAQRDGVTSRRGGLASLSALRSSSDNRLRIDESGGELQPPTAIASADSHADNPLRGRRT